jgi:tetratricopeptide (TPR) repeat protein
MMSYNRIVRAFALTFLLGLIPLRAAAQDAGGVAVDHEEWKVIGWDDACGVAFEHLYYPVFGEAISGEPVSTRVGEARIPPGKENYIARWTYQADGPASWKAEEMEAAVSDLKKSGYTRPGFPESIVEGSIADSPSISETLRSTATLSALLKSGWPGPEWRWVGGSYSPLGTCALIAFENPAEPRRYRLLLLRVYNPRARLDRAYAHASNARLLFDGGNIDAAAPEAENAAALAPDLPMARYEHAAMLALTGRLNEAADELAAAVKLDKKYGAKARDDIDFAELRGREDFKALTRH